MARDQLQSAIGKRITKGVERFKDGANAVALHLGPATTLVGMAEKVMPTARKYWDAAALGAGREDGERVRILMAYSTSPQA